MQRPGLPPPQRPSTMNPLNFNRAASGASAGGNAGTTGGAPSPANYNYLPRPSPGANAGSGSTPFNRGFPFGASNLPPHLANFAGAGSAGSGAGAGQSTGQQGQSGSLNINDFPALGGSFNSAPSIGGGTMSYANSTVGNRNGAGVEAGLNTDDFPSLTDGFSVNAANGVGSQQANQEQASAAATLQHQRLAREQNPSQQTLNAARGGFGGDVDRNYATKVGMQQPPGMSAAQNWFSQNFGGAAAVAAGLNGSAPTGAGSLQSPALANQVANRALDGVGGQGGLDGQQGGAGNVGSGGLMLPNVGGGTAPGGTQSQAAGAIAKTPAQQVLTSPADRFGLVGLLNIIKMQDPDLSMLAMGSDLQTLGLNLGAQDSLSASFVTPWSDNAAAAALQVEPEFHLPSCYNVQPPPPASSKIASFSDETLFFIFYSTPRDVLQEVAAQELYNRNWRFYRGGLNMWLTKEENVQPTHKDLRAEKGVYIFWDPASWSKISREFVLAYDALEDRSNNVNQAQLLGANSASGQGGQQTSSVQQLQGTNSAQNSQAQQGQQGNQATAVQ
ncbi:uncharacterized protein FA14DRAFT_25976 [Meira miltonrushii]|uniref:NOT2/NOT3/NOT5 C-terminal domain-containing protein n=1 Tax=Meira miltonrushii TaxID=1280837 RepID=A0A316VLZ8_9BASI|nr:uncharacterized protein FA14DRAFT_25976 [Meira miltonrushii]PWN38340.1 hypothetical protein FA14DRAFT_25976 [Meira miltonrushii]